MSGPMLTQKEKKMVNDMVDLNHWPRALAEDVVRQVSRDGIDVLTTLKDQKRITPLQSLQVRHYLLTRSSRCTHAQANPYLCGFACALCASSPSEKF